MPSGRSKLIRTELAQLRHVVATLLATLPASLYVAKPTLAVSFSVYAFILFPVLFLIFAAVFQQFHNLAKYSESYIEVSLREIFVDTSNPSVLLRVSVYFFSFVFLALCHRVFIQAVHGIVSK